MLRFRFILLVNFVLAIAATAQHAFAEDPSLFVAGNTFTTSSHYVSTTVFPWFTSTTGQSDGPWMPLEGRAAWTGEPAFWQNQVKQMMAANIDVLMIHQHPGPEYVQQRTNLFQALHDLRAQGYNVPKVAPFVNTSALANWGTGPAIDLGTSAGKDTFVDQYVQFYNQYYSVNTDAYADSYIAQLSGRVILNNWALMPEWVENAHSLTRLGVQSRLRDALGGTHALFNKNVYGTNTFVINSVNGDHFTFEDERAVQFEQGYSYYYVCSAPNGRITNQVMPGYWDQNVRTPGQFLPRDGGSHYRDAWTSVQSERVGYPNQCYHVSVESWNEFDEGTGIYAADPGDPYHTNGNPNTDTWSSTNDPYEYIKTTAEGARLFNDTPDRAATILWDNLPATMRPGQVLDCQIVVQNTGDLSWTGAGGYKLFQTDSDSFLFLQGIQGKINDATNEIPTYGGIFRGRPITFDLELTAPMIPGDYVTHWRMLQENVTWFGDTLTTTIQVTLPIPEPSPMSLLTMGLLSIVAYSWRKRR